MQLHILHPNDSDHRRRELWTMINTNNPEVSALSNPLNEGESYEERFRAIKEFIECQYY